MRGLYDNASGKERDGPCIDILALLPQERTVYIETDLSTDAIEELLVSMPNIDL
jgi:hypothetical protein